MNERMPVAVIGLGNMGGAVVRGLLAAGVPENDILGLDLDETRAQKLGIREISSVRDIPANAFVVLAVKPHLAVEMAAALGKAEAFSGIVLSVAAGIPWESLHTAAGANPQKVAVVRAMPNTAAALGSSATTLYAPDHLLARVQKTVHQVVSKLGTVTWVTNEALMHAATAIAGSAPAFVYVFAEALEDAGVLEGLSRADARQLVATMIEGAGKVLGAHGGAPAELKDAVTSPGGTTIRGVAALDSGGFRAAVVDAVRAAAARSRELS